MASILCGVVAAACGIAAFQIPTLGEVWLGLNLLAIIIGFAAIVLLIWTGATDRASGIAQLLALPTAAVLINAFLFLPQLHNYNARRVAEYSLMRALLDIRSALEMYVEMEGHWPGAGSWCDALSGDQYAEVMLGTGRDKLRAFAFNADLDGRTPDKVPGNTVLLIEADGPWNNRGRADLLQASRSKFKYFVLAYPGFVHVLYTDGTIGRYRLRDGALAIYGGLADPCELNDRWFDKAFSRVTPRHTTPYSPLRWGGEADD
jgi:type II secretory pathway pseudopilin PulG